MKSIQTPSNSVLCLGLAFSDINIIWMNMSWTSKLDSEFSEYVKTGLLLLTFIL